MHSICDVALGKLSCRSQIEVDNIGQNFSLGCSYTATVFGSVLQVALKVPNFGCIQKSPDLGFVNV